MPLFFRWIRSPTSFLYDPAIEQAVFMLMRKLCLLMVTELNRMGAHVAHCSFSKVVVCTGRSDLKAARAFVETLRASLRDKKLFSSLNLIPTRYNRLMVWLNASNKAYVRCFDPMTGVLMEDVSFGRADTNQLTVYFQNNKAQTELQIAQTLLVAGDCRRVFNNVIIFYLNILSKQAREQVSSLDLLSGNSS